jgi:DNA-binding NarL/FixJ family response regulator
VLIAFGKLTKLEQRTLVEHAFTILQKKGEEEDGLSLTQFLEAAFIVDHSLVSLLMIEAMSRNRDFSVRSSAAAMLHLLAQTHPGDVPLDILLHLATPSQQQDWYVLMPAIAAFQLLSLIRPEALDVFAMLGESDERDRLCFLDALTKLAERRPNIVPRKLVLRLANDSNEAISTLARDLLKSKRLRPDGMLHPAVLFAAFE